MKRVLLLMFLLLGFAQWSVQSFANVLPGPPCRIGESREGDVYEYSKFQNANFVVHLTDWAGNNLGPGIPLQGINVPGNGSVAKLHVPKAAGACDAWNETILPPPGPGGPPPGPGGPGNPPGGKASLRIESLILNPNINEWEMYNIFDTVQFYSGLGNPFEIPDLYADTNGDGAIDDGDVLYGWVNLWQYIPTAPKFSLGDEFTLTNGQITAINGVSTNGPVPGIWFGTTDFCYDPTAANGFDCDPPYSGTTYAYTNHSLTATPEPLAITLFGVGCVGIGMIRRWLSQR